MTLNCCLGAFQVVFVVKNTPVNAGDIREAGLIPGGGHDNPLEWVAWRIPWTEEPGGLLSKGSRRVGKD